MSRFFGLVYISFMFYVQIYEFKQFLNLYNKKPKIYFISDNNRVLESRPLYVSCLATGTPPPNIKWFLNKMPIISLTEAQSQLNIFNKYHNRILSVNFKYKSTSKSTLIIKSSRMEDHLKFLTCEAVNVLGKNNQITKLIIQSSKEKYNLNYPTPKLIDKTSRQLKRLKEKVVLECHHSNSLHGRVYWYRNFEFMDQLINNVIKYTDKSKLIFDSISNNEEGVYRCAVVNQYGYGLSNAVAIQISDIPPNMVNLTVKSIEKNTAEICWKYQLTNAVIKNFKVSLKDLTVQTPENIPYNGKNVSFMQLQQQQKQKTGSSRSSFHQVPVSKQQNKSNYKVKTIEIKSDNDDEEIYKAASFLPATYLSTTTGTDNKIPTDFIYQKCHVLSTLNPYTTYQVGVTAQNDLGQSQIIQYLNFTTLPADPASYPRSITASALSNTAVEVRWKTAIHLNGKFKEYRVLYTEHPDLPNQHWRHFVVSQESALLSHLTSETKFYIRIQVFNDVGEGPLSPMISIITKAGTLSQCPEFQATLILLGRIELTWDDPDPGNIHNCQGFLLEITLQNGSSLKSEQQIIKINRHTRSYTMHDVAESVHIQLNLRPYNQAGNGMPSTLNLISAGMSNIKRNVIELGSIEAFTIFFKIRRPSLNSFNETIAIYKIIDKSDKQQFIMSIYLHNKLRETALISNSFDIDKWQNFNFTELLPNTQYQFKFLFLTSIQTTIRQAYYQTEIITTKFRGKYDAGYFHIQTNHSVTTPYIYAEWEALPSYNNDYPNNQKKSSVLYKFQFRVISPKHLESNFFSIITNQTFYFLQFKNHPAFGVTYEFILTRYKNKGGKSIKVINMPESKPTEAPSNLKIIEMRDDSIILKWHHPSIRHRNGRLIATEFLLSRIGSDDMTILRNHNDNFSISSVASFDNLVKTRYSIRARSYTNMGFGPWSKFLNFTISDIDINSPRKIRAVRITDSEMKVDWKMGVDKNGKLMEFGVTVFGFVIYYAKRDAYDDLSQWTMIRIDKEIYSSEIKQLLPEESYKVRMSSIDEYNRLGQLSPVSYPTVIESRLYQMKIVTNIKCCSQSSNYIHICAFYPTDTEYLKQINIAYSGQIKYWSPDNYHSLDIVKELTHIINYSGPEYKKFKATLPRLSPNTNYSIGLTPIYTKQINISQTYILTTKLICRTQRAVPNKIIPPKILDVSISNIRLRLYRVNEKRGKLDEYHLMFVPYKYSNHSIIKRFNRPASSFSLIELSSSVINSNLMMTSSQGNRQPRYIVPFVVLSRSTFVLFGDASYVDYDLDLSQSDIPSIGKWDIIYRSALRACLKMEEGHLLCHTSDWSNQFRITISSMNLPQSENPTVTSVVPLLGQNSNINKHEVFRSQSDSNKEHSIITLSVTLTGILLALVSIVGGCIIHRRKFIQMKWSNLAANNFQNDGNSLDHCFNLITQGPSDLSAAHKTNSNQCLNGSPDMLQDTNQFSIPLIQLNHVDPSQPNYSSTSNNSNNNNIPSRNSDTIKRQQQSTYQLDNADNRTPDLVNIKENPLFTKDSVVTTRKSDKLDIPVYELGNYFEELKIYDNVKLAKQFDEICKISSSLTIDSSVSELEENKLKNRYANIVAFNHCLVLLQNQFDSSSKASYINANYINGYRKQNEYIATQGPLRETIDDFWQMVWEQRSTVIIMLLRIDDNESKKCECYWPNKGTRIFRSIEVTILSCCKRTHYIIRQFHLKQNGMNEKRQIIHLQFISWPDQGVPILSHPFVDFVKFYRSINQLDCGPVVVHCSAGVGRTGVFIAFDSQIQKLNHEQTINIFNQVLELRKQRIAMVQTEIQYGFIYELIMEWIHSRNFSNECSLSNFSKLVNKLNCCQNMSQRISGFEVEFQAINNFFYISNDALSAVHGYSVLNHSKNNSPHIVPYDWNRVTIPSLNSLEGSDYINASYIDSYTQQKAFIVTQNPTPNTVEDFWRMIWEQRCSIIVVLGQTQEFQKDNAVPYWPQNKSIRYQFFVVDPIVEYDMSFYYLREFKVTDARDCESRTIRQFHYTHWTEQSVPSDFVPFVDFINQIKLNKDNLSHHQPILVHCSYGSGKSGIFVSIHNLIEQLSFDKKLNVWMTVRLLQRQRMGLIHTVNQYQYCYLSIMSFINSTLSSDNNNQIHHNSLHKSIDRRTDLNKNGIDDDNTIFYRTNNQMVNSQLLGNHR